MSRDLQLICVKKFVNKFYLILLNSKILFDVMGAKKVHSAKVMTSSIHNYTKLAHKHWADDHSNLKVPWFIVFTTTWPVEESTPVKENIFPAKTIEVSPLLLVT